MYLPCIRVHFGESEMCLSAENNAVLNSSNQKISTSKSKTEQILEYTSISLVNILNLSRLEVCLYSATDIRLQKKTKKKVDCARELGEQVQTRKISIPTHCCEHYTTPWHERDANATPMSFILLSLHGHTQYYC